ncbi:MAG: hypothetical protein GXY36_13820 [Chloroflexi bacterium]|nr:hypothetical protein [Chloroflexota bacterium]
MAQFSTYVPDYRLLINGQDIPPALRGCITSIRYQDGMGAADRVEIALANPDLRFLQEHIRGLGFRPFPTALTVGPFQVGSVVPTGLFDMGNKLELDVGYTGGIERMFKGDITGVQVSFPNGGMPTMTLVAHDYLSRLMQGKYARGFDFLPDALIAAILSAENLLIPFIDPAVMAISTGMAVLNAIFKGTGRKQKGQSDLELLQEIAKTYDADFWVDGDVLYLSRFLKEYEPRLTLPWGGGLLDFSPEISLIGQVAGVGARFTLREIPLDFLVTAFWDFDRESLGISVVPGAAASAAKTLLGPVFTRIDKPITSPVDIVNSALELAHELRAKLNNRLTGQGSALGDPRIRAGAVIRLEGLGPDFSGNYRVTSATHTIDSSGYHVNFGARRDIIP